MSEQSLQTEEPSIDPRTLARLSSRKPQERGAAEDEVRQLGPEAVDALLVTLRREAGRRKRNYRLGGAIICVYLLLCVVMAVTGHMDQFATMSGMISTATVLMVATQGQKNAARMLAEFDDIRCVGPLAEALHYQDKGLYQQARQRLLRLLPRLRASDSDRLTGEQRACLGRVIHQKDPELAVAILKAFQQVGDSACIRFVEPHTRLDETNSKARPVREAAIETLPFLKQREEQERAARTLLRPASSPDDPSAVLLRPAQNDRPIDPDVLLRPADSTL